MYLIDKYSMPVTNFYIALCYSVLGFLLMVPVGFLSFRFIESPFLRMRTKYIIEEQTEAKAETES